MYWSSLVHATPCMRMHTDTYRGCAQRFERAWVSLEIVRIRKQQGVTFVPYLGDTCVHKVAICTCKEAHVLR